MTPKNAIPVTFVSRDRNLLRQLAGTLTESGYRVFGSDDWSEKALWRNSAEAEIWLLDARDPEAAAALALPRDFPARYVISLASAEEPDAATRLLSAGADDVVTLPINHGELLARLRSARRRLEFERRLVRRSIRDPLTGLYTRSGFARKAFAASVERGSGNGGVLITFGIEAFDRVTQQLGTLTATVLCQEFARRLREGLTEAPDSVAAALKEGTFAVVLPNTKTEAGQAFATQVIEAFLASDTVRSQAASIPSVAAVVGEWNATQSPMATLSSCTSALQFAGLCGATGVAPLDEVQAVRDAFSTSDADTDALQGVTAGDLAEPFSMLLNSEGPVATTTAWELDPEWPTPPCVPVIDKDYQLIGTVEPLHAIGLGSQTLPADLIQAAAATVSHDTPVGQVFAGSGHDPDSAMIVLKDKTPIGFLTPDTIESLTHGAVKSLASRSADSNTELSGLVVPIA